MEVSSEYFPIIQVSVFAAVCKGLFSCLSFRVLVLFTVAVTYWDAMTSQDVCCKKNADGVDLIAEKILYCSCQLHNGSNTSVYTVYMTFKLFFESPILIVMIYRRALSGMQPL